MFEILMGFTPFTGKSIEDLESTINKGKYGVPKEVKISLNCLDLLNKCLQYNPKKRISHEELLNHPFFSEEELKEKILLCSSVCNDKPFEIPKSSKYTNEDNSFMFDTKNSCLFTNTYQQWLERHKNKYKDQDSESKESDNEDKDNKGLLTLSEAKSIEEESDSSSAEQINDQKPIKTEKINSKNDENNDWNQMQENEKDDKHKKNKTGQKDIRELENDKNDDVKKTKDYEKELMGQDNNNKTKEEK